ncbi:MAG: helix-turn-helix transcriptional regulator [Victivallales bacterium]|nr:helix-turn-helix transcriptional regulator [Victivallales bacterium]
MRKKETFDVKAVGLRMRHVRIVQRKTQARMAHDLGISQSHYSKLEVGLGGMSRSLAYTFCRMHQLDGRWFFEGNEEFAPDENMLRANADNSVEEIENGLPNNVLKKIVETVLDRRMRELANNISKLTNVSLTDAYVSLLQNILSNKNTEKNDTPTLASIAFKTDSDNEKSSKK